ncbi:hypothetical protein MN2019_17895 [Mycolicibacterium neoaurum]|uniref:hypothetical protein n=1 Tax=Mycolicibacterium neoaurum TaxID=1795 RepID=UPI001BCAF395|nr:hypothetical protein [Mycolicibacterium neoaurum]QVI26175.1 hypothetical protein MN2019_17895 [Mycolicibacterium neoaurum]
MNAPAKDWADSMNWRAKHPDELARFAEVIAAVECLRQHDAASACGVFAASGVPARRHVPYALSLLSAALEDRAAGLTDRLLDNPFGFDTHGHAVQVTVTRAAHLWGEGELAKLTDLARTAAFSPRDWVLGVCALLAAICADSSGYDWLLTKAKKLDELMKRGEK